MSMHAREKGASIASNVQTLLVNLKTGPLQQPTELLKLPSKGIPTWQALIIPGNPGVAAFYTPLMQGLWKSLGGLVDVFCVSQLGHNPQCHQQNQGRCNLKDQIQHKAAFIREHMLVPGRPPAIILGHSIGAYMALHAVQQIEQTSQQHSGMPEIVQILAVCPFLAADWRNNRQRLLRLVTRQPAILGYASALLGSLPLALKRWIVTSYASGLEPHALQAALGLLQWQPAVNALHLAKHEFIDLDSPAEWWLLKHFGARVTVLCAPNDMWFSDAEFSQMEQEVPTVQADMGTWTERYDSTHMLGLVVYDVRMHDDVHRWKTPSSQHFVNLRALMLEGQRHAFCTSTALSYAMAEACTSILQDISARSQANAQRRPSLSSAQY